MSAIDDIFDGVTRLPDEDVVLAGRYRIVRELGRGAQGLVYLAEDLNFGDRRVAIEMPPAVLARNRKAIATHRAEAEMAMRLSHPNIVTLRTFESTDEGVFLVMDHVEGRTLEDLLADEGVLLAKALDHAHGEQVVHREVKPSNILIRAEDGRPLLTDFGIARELKDAMTFEGSIGIDATLYVCLAGLALLPRRDRGPDQDEGAGPPPARLALHAARHGRTREGPLAASRVLPLGQSRQVRPRPQQQRPGLPPRREGVWPLNQRAIAPPEEPPVEDPGRAR